MADERTAKIAHLHRRAGFGATPAELAASVARGYDATVEALLDRTTPDAGTARVTKPDLPIINPNLATTTAERNARTKQRVQLSRSALLWWLDRMALAQQPLREKLTLFWHGHFATSIEKVNQPALMVGQNETMRALGGGSFATLTQAMAKDPAMIRWLDTDQNVAGKPNENFARELMELFTIGIGSYTDADVREAARAFTGWRVVRGEGAFQMVPRLHDNGSKTLFGRTGNLSGEDVVDLLVRHPNAAPFVVSKVWSRFAYPVGTTDAVVRELAPAFAKDLDITALLRNVLKHPQFTSTQARQGLVKQPIEWLVGTCRALGLTPSSLSGGGATTEPRTALDSLGQVPFAPPSVGGWPQNGYWLSTATSLARARFARAAATKADLSWLTGVPAAQRPDVLAGRLCLDGWTTATAAAITTVDAPVDQLAVALVSPENVLA